MIHLFIIISLLGNFLAGLAVGYYLCKSYSIRKNYKDNLKQQKRTNDAIKTQDNIINDTPARARLRSKYDE